DVLMTFTSRRTNSYLCPSVVGQVQHVVYGHAEVGELNAAGAWVGGAAPNDFATHVPATMVFPSTADTWHLARRSVLIVDGFVTGPCAAGGLVEFYLDNSGARMTNILDGASDVVARNPANPFKSFNYLNDVVGMASLPAPSGATLTVQELVSRSRLDLQPPAPWASRLGHYLLRHCASFKVEWALDLRKFATAPGPIAVPNKIRFNPLPGLVNSAPQELTWFDPFLPPVGGGALAEMDTLAATYDTAAPAVAGDLRTLGNTIAARFANPALALLPTAPVFFGNDVPNLGSIDEPDRFFPDALRITVDVYDPAQKLERPIRHVMVLPVGR
ncbi:MAG: hypothetical protein GY778_21525, partial [bacterium]|nr:hypothetical protein [bacterium]